jgi:hypothetical protein
MSKLLILNKGRWVAASLVSGIISTRTRADLLAHALESELAVDGAGGSGLELVPSGCGVCCPSFSSVQERTRIGWKRLTWWVQGT